MRHIHSLGAARQYTACGSYSGASAGQRVAPLVACPCTTSVARVARVTLPKPITRTDYRHPAPSACQWHKRDAGLSGIEKIDPSSPPPLHRMFYLYPFTLYVRTPELVSRRLSETMVAPPVIPASTCE
jgi:hypothetical protein